MGITQGALAYDLGEGWSQKRICILERQEFIDTPILAEISAILKIPVEAFLNFSEVQMIKNLASNFSGCAADNMDSDNQNLHPLDKLKKLHVQKVSFYERILAVEKELLENWNHLFQIVEKSINK